MFANAREQEREDDEQSDTIQQENGFSLQYSESENQKLKDLSPT